jgi:small-conductance mechanosensitive channel
MDGVVGTLLLAAAILLFGWTMVEFRRPEPRRWARAETSGIALLCITMSLFAFGTGYLVRFVLSLNELRLDMGEVAAIGAVLIALWLGLLGLRAHRRRIAISDCAAGEAPSAIVEFPSGSSPPNTDHGIGPSRPVGGGKRARRRKAA